MQTNTADDYRELADAMDNLRTNLKNADSIAEDCPVLSELFHEVRTSKRNSRDGKYVALLDYDSEDGWSCRSVAFLESGTHYRDTGADMSLGFSPYPFISVDEFSQHISSYINEGARATRQTAGNIEQSKKEKARRKKMMENGR